MKDKKDKCKECGHELSLHRYGKCQKMLGMMGSIKCRCKRGNLK